MPAESVRLQWKSTVLAHIQKIRIYAQIFILAPKGSLDIPLICPGRRALEILRGADGKHMHLLRSLQILRQNQQSCGGECNGGPGLREKFFIKEDVLSCLFHCLRIKSALIM